jgi:sulfur-oxidizing protein SoxX
MLKRLILSGYLLMIACTNFESVSDERLTKGKEIAFTRSKGNCLACHVIANGSLAGNIGPELQHIAQRFKTPEHLRQFIWDATLFNSETAMPPFGKNKILSKSEIRLLVDYLWTL